MKYNRQLLMICTYPLYMHVMSLLSSKKMHDQYSTIFIVSGRIAGMG